MHLLPVAHFFNRNESISIPQKDQKGDQRRLLKIFKELVQQFIILGCILVEKAIYINSILYILFFFCK